MPESMLPPPDDPEGGTGANNSEDSGGNNNKSPGSNPFDQFINDDLDLSFMEPDSDGTLPPPPDEDAPTPPARRPGSSDTPFRGPFSMPPLPPKSSNPFNRPLGGNFDSPFSGSSPRNSLSGRLGRDLPSKPLSPLRNNPMPALMDPRWQRGTYRVRRDLRIYKAPSKLSQRVAIVPDAHHRIDKSLRYIANVVSGWSVVHLQGEEAIIGFVDNSEVQLFPRRGLRDIWEDVVLVVCLLLLVLVLIANLEQVPFLNETDGVVAFERISELEEIVTEQQAQIDDLEAMISTLQGEGE